MQIVKQFFNNHKFPRYPHFFSPSPPSSSTLHLFLDSFDPPSSYAPKPLHFSTGSLHSDFCITAHAPHPQFCSYQSASRYTATFTHPVFDIRFPHPHPHSHPHPHPHPRPRLFLFSITTSASSVSLPAKMNKRHHGVRAKRFNSKLTAKERAEIVDAVILHQGNCLDSHLNMVSERLSIDCLIRIFSVLNGQRVSGLSLFTWVSNRKPRLYRNSNFCSLIIENCGWLGDYETMASILIDFKSKNLCLTSKAFCFLPVLRTRGSSHDSNLLGESITKVIQVLDKVGGSSRSSGIVGLITMLCELEAFEMADFVMSITERKTQYFRVVIREMCKKCYFEEARKTLEQMRDFLCEPDVKIYNYLLSTLCKNRKLAEAHNVFEEMKKNGTYPPPPDALTFDIFIHFTASHGMLVAATQFLNEMINMGLEPRISTHAAIIKWFLHSGGRLDQEVYNREEYDSTTTNSSKVVVADSRAHHHHQRHFNSSNIIYCLLAGFHKKKGDIVRATNILIKMMDKGLRPNLSIYRKVLNQLKKDCHEDLARDLKNRFSSLEELVSSSSSSCAAVTS